MMTINTDTALQMLQAGWTVRYFERTDQIEWRSPCGRSGHDFYSNSLDNPPDAAVAMAKQQGDIVYRPRVG